MKRPDTCILALLILALSATPASSDKIPAPTDSPLFVGTGYNSTTSAACAECVQGDTLRTISGAFGQQVEFHLESLETKSELRKSLGIDAKATFGVGLFKADASVNYLSSQVTQSFCSYLLVKVRVTNQTEYLTHRRLTPAAREYTVGSPQFERMCGTKYVIGRTLGGEFQGIIRIKSSDMAEKRQVDASLKASLATYSVSGNIHDALSSSLSSKEVTVDLTRSGGRNFPRALTADQLIEYALSFPSTVAHGSGGEFPYDLIVADYASIAMPQFGGDSTLSPLNALEERAVDAYLDAAEVRDEIQDVIKNPRLYDLRTGAGPAGLADLEGKYLDRIRGAIDSLPLVGHALAAQYVAQLASPSTKGEDGRKSLEMVSSTSEAGATDADRLNKYITLVDQIKRLIPHLFRWVPLPAVEDNLVYVGSTLPGHTATLHLEGSFKTRRNNAEYWIFAPAQGYLFRLLERRNDQIALTDKGICRGFEKVDESTSVYLSYDPYGPWPIADGKTYSTDGINVSYKELTPIDLYQAALFDDILPSSSVDSTRETISNEVAAPRQGSVAEADKDAKMRRAEIEQSARPISVLHKQPAPKEKEHTVSTGLAK